MLFKIRHPETSVDFTCVISSDGCLFFKVLDLLKIAGLSRNLACRHFHLTIKDVVHKGLPLPPSLCKTRICDLGTVGRIPGLEGFQEELMGSRVGFIRDIKPTFHPKKTETLLMIDSDTTFPEFLQKFTMDCLIFYERMLEPYTHMDFEIPSCINYGLSDGPKTVRLLSRNENGLLCSFLYKRIK